MATDNDYAVDEDTTASGNVPGDDIGDGVDSDLGNDPLSVVLEGGVSKGTLTLESDGAFVHTPTLNYAGTLTFTYHADDGSADSNIATVTLAVSAVNDPPTISAIADRQIEEGGSGTDRTVTIVPTDGTTGTTCRDGRARWTGSRLKTAATS